MTIRVADIKRVEEIVASLPATYEWLELRDIETDVLEYMANHFADIWIERFEAREDPAQILFDTMANSFRFGYECALEFGKKGKGR